MVERGRGRFGGVRAGAAALVTVGVLGLVCAPALPAEARGPAGGSQAAAGAAPGLTSSPSAAAGAGATAVSPKVAAISAAGWDAAAAAAFWTPARLDSALPVDAPHGPAGPADGSAARPTAGPAAGSARGPALASAPDSMAMAHSYHFAGTPSTGVIFYASQKLTTHYCTASVVDSRYGNLIIMAAHCNPGHWMAYVPKYQRGAARQPYGIWAVTKVFKDAHYTGGFGAGSDYDYAFAQVATNSRHQTVQSVTGGYRLSRTPGYDLYVTALGYPKVRADATDEAIRCRPGYRTHKLPGYRQLVLYCTGFYGGTSGGPWITSFNGRTGNLVGITGGYQDGGPNSWTSYSPVFDGRILALFGWAESH